MNMRALRPEAVVAIRAGQPIPQAVFWRDVAALAARLPAQNYVVNLCTDRYRFMTGLFAALQAGQVSLLPAANLPSALAALAEDYPDLYALTDDGARPALRCMEFPADLHGGMPAPDALALPATQPAAILFTSGSTGRPKPALKTWSTLLHSAQAAGARLGIAGMRGGSIVGTVPHHHSYGLESIILLGLLHGLAIDTSWPLFPADIRAALARAPRPRVFVTTPVHLRALLATPDDMPPVDLVLSATAPLSADQAAAAEACFRAPLIEIYGCTEAGQLATRRTAQDESWHCLDGVAFRQDSDSGTWASGPATPGPTLLHDVIDIIAPGRFTLGARNADLVDVAGKRSSLAYLDQQLLSIAGVQDGAFVTGTAPGRVPRLAAVAVAPGLQARDIIAALRARIDPAFLPRPLRLVDSLPRNKMGKLPRADLLRLIGQAP
jgi:acyl-coenzyme A synthetase/AMP-(fatty) acid ligase